MTWLGRDSGSHGDSGLRSARSARRYLQPSSTVAARITAQHPQLRDLLVCLEESEVAHLSGRCIDVLSFPNSAAGRRLASSQARLPFKANCLATGQGLLCAGGQNTELAVRSLDEGYAYEDWSDANFSVAGSINNSIFVAPPTAAGSRARLYCSNNDQTLTLWDVVGPSDDAGARANLVRADILPLNTAINAAALSPDGRMALAVGDTADVFLFEVSSGGKHRLVKTMTASKDSGFSVSWARNSLAFAVGSQDGVVTVFDARNCRESNSLDRSKEAGKLASLLTSNVGPYSSAARVVRYSPGSSTELLAFTEQCGLAHVLDARTYDEQHAQHLFLSASAHSVRTIRRRRSSFMDAELAQLASLPPDAGRALRLAALTPPLPPSQAGDSVRHARRLVAQSGHSRSSSGAGSPVMQTLRSYELHAVGPNDLSSPKEDTEVIVQPELCGLTWAPNGEKLYIATETAVAEYSRHRMASEASPASWLL